MMKTEYRGPMSPMMAQDEAGASDNRLYLDPNDDRWKGSVDSWEDGKTYTFKNVVVRQESPGQFEVVSAEPAETESEAEDATETGEEPGETGSMGKASEEAPSGDSIGYTNPAVARLIAEKNS